jgi:hypothetical protein
MVLVLGTLKIEFLQPKAKKYATKIAKRIFLLAAQLKLDAYTPKQTN